MAPYSPASLSDLSRTRFIIDFNIISTIGKIVAEIRLSICIPTYNFAEFIETTLETIVPQIVEGVEIDILDGGSTDNTAAIIARWQMRCSAIRFHQQGYRGGIDQDIARVVALSRGTYFWLFSADDIMFAGSIDRILSEIKSDMDVYLCAHQERAFDLSPRLDRHPTTRLLHDSEFNFSKMDNRYQYFDASYTTAAFFSYLSSLVIRRESWNSEKLDDRFVGSCWAHAFRLLNIMKNNMRLKYISKPLLAWRADNDSFASGGIVSRCALAIEGYNRMADIVFGHYSIEAAHIRRVLRNEYTLGYYLLAKKKLIDASADDRKQLDRLAALTFGDDATGNWLRRMIYRLSPATMVHIILGFWQIVRPWAKPLMNNFRRRRI